MKSAPYSPRGLVLLLTLLACALVSTAPASADVSIVIGGRPMSFNPGPIEQAGRVFVPLRGIFESLGASVVYQAGTINATKGRTTVSLQIGSTQATIDGQSTTLDVAPFIVGESTYVPLRFIAQALGATVNYNDSSQVVSIAMPHAPPPYVPPVRPPNPPPRPPAPPPPPPVGLVAPAPAAGSTVTNRFSTIAASFSRQANPNSVRVWLDGADRTNQSGISATGFSFKPPAPLAFGSHTVRVAGNAPGGMPFDRSWSFYVARTTPSIHLTITQPAPNTQVGTRFVLLGSTVANARITVTAGASPASTGQFAGTTTAGTAGNFQIVVNLKTLVGQQAVTLKVTAADPVTGATTSSTLRLLLQ